MKNQIKKVICHDIEGNTYEVLADALSFRPAVYGIIINNGKILLSKQWSGYDFPGGGIELGETIEAALIREVKEETGMDIKVGDVIHCQHSFFKMPFKERFVHSIHMFYSCTVTGGHLSTDFLADQEKEYADMPEWIDLKEVASIKLCSSAKAEEVLKNYL